MLKIDEDHNVEKIADAVFGEKIEPGISQSEYVQKALMATCALNLLIDHNEIKLHQAIGDILDELLKRGLPPSVKVAKRKFGKKSNKVKYDIETHDGARAVLMRELQQMGNSVRAFAQRRAVTLVESRRVAGDPTPLPTGLLARGAPAFEDDAWMNREMSPEQWKQEVEKMMLKKMPVAGGEQ